MCSNFSFKKFTQAIVLKVKHQETKVKSGRLVRNLLRSDPLKNSGGSD